jgi:hypothetical protein
MRGPHGWVCFQFAVQFAGLYLLHRVGGRRVKAFSTSFLGYFFRVIQLDLGMWYPFPDRSLTGGGRFLCRYG